MMTRTTAHLLAYIAFITMALSTTVHAQTESIERSATITIYNRIDNLYSVRFDESSGMSRVHSLGDVLEAESINEVGFSEFDYAVYRTRRPLSTEFVEAVRQDPGILGVLPVYATEAGDTAYIDPVHIVVRFRDDVPRSIQSTILSDVGYIAERRVSHNLVIVKVRRGLSPFSAVTALSEDSSVDVAELMFYNLEPIVGSDTYLDDSWHLDNTGQISGYTIGNDSNVRDAWDIATGEDIVVTIIDTGIDLTHPDLQGNILPRGNEDWNFASSSSNVPNEGAGHGTAIAGIASAISNSVGVRGVAFGSQIMPLKVTLFPNQTVQQTDAINYAIDYAIANDVEMVINCSWHVDVEDASLNAAIARAAQYDIPIFFASGNDNLDEIWYPASEASAIAVGAMAPCNSVRKDPNTCDGETNWGSNYGVGLDIAAPGVHMYTTDEQGEEGYNYTYTCTELPCTPLNDLSDIDYSKKFNGTSSASPVVAGVAALVLSVNPVLSASEVRDVLLSTADEVGGYSYTNGISAELGHGRVNAYEAVKYTLETYGGIVGGAGQTVILHEDVTVEPGAVLTIASGTTVKFDTGVQLRIDGTLQASNVYFKAHSSSWDGIYFTSGSGGTISGGSITGVSGVPVQISGASPTIENVEFDNPNAGPQIHVTGSSADVLLDGNSFNGGGDGVNLEFNAQATLLGNTFSVDGSALTTHFSAMANMSPYTGGGNRLGGGTNGVYADYQSTVYAGSGGNHFCTGSSDYIFANHSGTAVYATNAFWPENPPSAFRIEAFGGATVDTSYYAQSSCSSGSMVIVAEEQENSRSVANATTLVADASNGKNIRQKLRAAIDLMQRSAATDNAADRATAAMWFREIIADAPGEPEAAEALLGIWRIVRLEKSQGQRHFLETIAAEPGPVRPTALAILAGAYDYWSLENEAYDVAATLESEYPSTWYAFYGAMSRFWMHLDAGRYEEAQIVLDTLDSLDEEERQRVEEARELLARVSSRGSDANADYDKTGPESSEGPALQLATDVSVYPNPFNPAATIQYSVKTEGRVVLKVYNVLGEQVRTLVDDVQSSGMHSVRFAADELASGLYLYRLEVGGTKAVGKMLLVK